MEPPCQDRGHDQRLDLDHLHLAARRVLSHQPDDLAQNLGHRLSRNRINVLGIGLQVRGSFIKLAAGLRRDY